MRKINIIPLAGKGERFAKANYMKPKPMIDVFGKPMFVRAAKSLPRADLWIFICLKEHVKKYRINHLIKKNFKKTKIIILNKITDGQLSTVLKAKKFLKSEDEIFIGNCDSILNINLKKFSNFKKNSDVIVMSFKDKLSIKANPNMYAYIKTILDNEILKVSCKKPFTKYPENEYALTGYFYFKKTSYLIDSANKILKKNIRTKNEFYLDQTINYLKKNLIVKNFFVKNFINLGTPQDFKKNLKKV